VSSANRAGRLPGADGDLGVYKPSNPTQAVRAALEDVVKRRRRQVGIDMLKSGELVIEDRKSDAETDAA
jgi:hypothetical protein